MDESDSKSKLDVQERAVETSPAQLEPFPTSLSMPLIETSQELVDLAQ